jgi:hypothetical protein
MRKLLLLLFLASGFVASAQTNESVILHLVSPLDYQVFQRQNASNGTIIIECSLETKARGTLTDLDRLEARLVDSSASKNSSDQWQPLPFDNRVRRFRAELPALAGGWYRLEVRLLSGKAIVSQASADHVGVGEVFVVAGQSNSANHGEGKQHATNALVVAFGKGRWQPAADPEPGASGTGGSFMPAFGDAMADKFKVPIGIVPIGVGSTSVREWLPRGDAMAAPPTTGLNTILISSNHWISAGDHFNKIITVENEFGTNGFRAVLWHQGESDVRQAPDREITPATYRQYLQHVIDVSRAAAGWRVPWFIAQVSYHTPEDQGSPELRAAQKSLVTDGIALAGPNTDELGPEFRQDNGRGIHMNARGLQRHGELWAQFVGVWLEQQLASKPASQ